MKAVFREPFFLFGLVVRLMLIGFAVPWTQQSWFVPFMASFVAHPTIDPWGEFLRQGGDRLAFPYGPIMLLAYLPGSIVGEMARGALGLAQAPFIGFGLCSLGLELMLFWAMIRLSKMDAKRLLVPLWLSPMAVYICYWHGQTDIVPIVLLVVSLLALRNHRAAIGGVLLGLGIAAKLSMFLSVPFIAVYLWRNARQRILFVPFGRGLIATVALSTVLCIMLPGFREMVLGSREFHKVYSAAVELGGQARVFVLPLAYSLVLYAAWRVERTSFDLFLAFIGLGFFTVLLLTPASTGWYLWVLPFVVFTQLRCGVATASLGAAFGGVFVLTNALFASGASIPVMGINLQSAELSAADPHCMLLHSALLSIQCVLGALFCLQMITHGVARSDYFRLSRKPIVVGIAGDSGAGKDTLASAIAQLFGEECVTSISGDDYHRWDRHAPMWRVLTHLDPRANELARFARDVGEALDGKRLVTRRYDHATGRFFREQRNSKNDVVIVSGLHALFVPAVAKRLDLSIFLDMAEELRTHLKVKRDVGERGRDVQGVLANIAKRQPDADKFIRPQVAKADIVFSLGVSDSRDVESCVRDSRYRLDVLFRNGVPSDSIVRTLIGLCGMQVDTDLVEGSGTVKVTIEGDVSPEDISMAARPVAQGMEELLAREPQWQPGMLGVMQFISLLQINDSLQTRITHVY